MKKIQFSFLVIIAIKLLFCTSVVFTQSQIYYTNFTDTSSSLPPGWSNTGTCIWALSSNNPSSGYNGASGGGNVYIGSCTGSAQLQVSNINTFGYSNIQIKWGARKSGVDINSLQWSSDGSIWTSVSYSDVTGNSTWALVNNGTPITINGAGGVTNLRFRWTITNPTDYRMDDFTVTGTTVPTKLIITSVIGSTCALIVQNVPFTVTVQSLNAANIPAPVTSNTIIQLSKAQGSGTLGGNLTGTILAGTSTVSISGITYTASDNLKIMAETNPPGTLTSYTTDNIQVRGPVTGIAFLNLSANGTTNNIFPAFFVIGQWSGGNDSGCFNGTITISKVSGPGNILGTLTKQANGFATFNDLIFTQAGTYVIKATCPGLQNPDVISNPIYITDGAILMNELKIPLYMEGKPSVNNERLMSAYLIEIVNLLPNTMYKYYNRAVVNGDPANFDGVGNPIFININGNFTRTTNPNFITSGDYGTFTTNNLGRYAGWFIIESVQDTRFNPGNEVYMRIILNDGTTTNRITTTKKIKILDLGTGVPYGSFLVADPSNIGHQPSPKNLLAFYGDSAGTEGRPMSISVTESDGLTLTTPPYLSGYTSIVDGINYKGGTIIKNQNPAGIIKIEEYQLSYNLDNGSDLINPMPVSTATSPNGIWSGVDTRNPTNGTLPLIINPVFIVTSITKNNEISDKFSLSQNYPNPFNPSTSIKFELASSSFTKLTVYDYLGREVAILINEKLNAGTYTVEWKASDMASGLYFYKIDTESYTDIKKMVLVK